MKNLDVDKYFPEAEGNCLDIVFYKDGSADLYDSDTGKFVDHIKTEKRS